MVSVIDTTEVMSSNSLQCRKVYNCDVKFAENMFNVEEAEQIWCDSTGIRLTRPQCAVIHVVLCYLWCGIGSPVFSFL